MTSGEGVKAIVYGYRMLLSCSNHYVKDAELLFWQRLDLCVFHVSNNDAICS